MNRENPRPSRKTPLSLKQMLSEPTDQVNSEKEVAIRSVVDDVVLCSRPGISSLLHVVIPISAYSTPDLLTPVILFVRTP